MIDSGIWLLDETKPLTSFHLEDLDRELTNTGLSSRGGNEISNLSVLIHDITIHDNKKWFGEADIRLDALVITGKGINDSPDNFYMPRTASFGRVKDGESLPIGDGGLIVYNGPARHFIDIFIMVSRDSKDTDDLASLLEKKLSSGETKDAVSGLLGLTMAVPTVGAITAALSAAVIMGDLAYRLLRAASSTTIGLYRNTHMQVRDGFGIGPHPGPNNRCFRVKDLSFRYEILCEQINI
jgi:hypothetical protein